MTLAVSPSAIVRCLYVSAYIDAHIQRRNEEFPFPSIPFSLEQQTAAPFILIVSIQSHNVAEEDKWRE